MADGGKKESPAGDIEPTPAGDSAIADVEATSGPATLPAPVSFPGILAIADSLPVMIAYLDRQQRYTFVNRTLADWLEQPRKSFFC